MIYNFPGIVLQRFTCPLVKYPNLAFQTLLFQTRIVPQEEVQRIEAEIAEQDRLLSLQESVDT